MFSWEMFVRETLGQDFTESSPIVLGDVFEDTSAGTPVIFILSTGYHSDVFLSSVFLRTSCVVSHRHELMADEIMSRSDPTGELIKFAEDMGYLQKFHSISLGQGQGPVAERLIAQSTKKGGWVRRSALFKAADPPPVTVWPVLVDRSYTVMHVQVCLMNCHLCTSWMPSLDKIVESFKTQVEITLLTENS